MHHYRIYLIDKTNHFAQALDFEGPDDLSALDKANLMRQCQPAEIWESTRLVARITSTGEAGQASNAPEMRRGI